MRHPDPFPWKNYVEKRVVVDGNVITGKGYAFIDFTGEVLDWMQVFPTPMDKEQFLKQAKEYNLSPVLIYAIKQRNLENYTF